MVDVLVFAIPQIQLKAVEHVLVRKVQLIQQEAKIVNAHRTHQGLGSEVIAGSHIQDKNLLMTVIVEVCDIYAHSIEGAVIEAIFILIFEGTVLLVDEDKIRNVIVITDVQVYPAILVQV